MHVQRKDLLQRRGNKEGLQQMVIQGGKVDDSSYESIKSHELQGLAVKIKHLSEVKTINWAPSASLRYIHRTPKRQVKLFSASSSHNQHT